MDLVRYIFKDFGSLPAEYDKRIHGVYDPARYYGKPDTPLAQVKLGELGAWFSRRNMYPVAMARCISRAYWRVQHKYYFPANTGIRFVWQAIAFWSAVCYIMNTNKILEIIPKLLKSISTPKLYHMKTCWISFGTTMSMGQLRKLKHKSNKLIHRNFCKSRNGSNGDNGRNLLNKLPEEPTNCCMSGCANCVWIEYARKLTEFYELSNDTARAMILKKVNDPNMRAFLQLELNKDIGEKTQSD